MKKNVKVLTCTMLSMMLANSGLAVYAKDGDDTDTTKDETIYAILNSDGTVEEQIVSSWLHNDHGIKNIKENLDIKDVKNVKSDEKPNISGNTYTWDSESNDIYYEGTTTKKLPVNVNVTYKLDGKEIKGKDLIGKSGKLEIHIQMKNTQTKVVNINGKNTNIHPLYVGAGVVDLSSDHFKNVKINHGTVLSEGNNQVVGFVSIPGLEDTLKSSNIDPEAVNYSDEYVIECETNDFELGPIMVTFTPEVPLDKLKDIDSFDDLTKGLNDLTSASEQLLDGTTQLADGTNTFNSKMKELVDGVPTLTNGVDTLKNGTGQLVSGSTALSSNLNVLQNGLSQAKEGTSALVSATGSMNELVDGIKQVNGGNTALAAGLKDGSAQLNGLLTSDIYQSVASSLSGLPDEINSLEAGLSQLANGVGQLQAGLSTVDANGNKTDLAVAEETVNLVAAQYAQACELDANSQECGIYKSLKGVTGALDNTRDGVNTLAEGVQGLASKQQELENLKSLATNASGLLSKVNDLSNNLNTAAQSAETLAAGTNQLNEKAGALLQLNPSLQKLDGALGQLQNGSSQLYTGSQTLTQGIQSADQGVAQLQGGAKTITNGAGQLYDASSLLASKTKELNNGMSTFKTSGIDEMNRRVTLTVDDINQILAIKDEIIKENETQHTFTGAPENSESKVKFIYKTEELEKTKKADTEKTTTTESKKENFLDKIGDFFKNLF